MELRHLRYFVAVAEAGSMTRAAERLGMQQPPLGQQIRLLEAELGVALFARLPKRIALNPAGELFLLKAREILASVEDATDLVRRFDRGERGRLALGFTSSASFHEVAPRLIRAFREAFPLVQTDVQESETFALILALQQKRIDAALVHLEPTRFPDLASFILADEHLVVAVPLDHHFAGSEAPLPLAALEGEPLVVYRRSDGPGIFERVLAAFETEGVRPLVVEDVQRLVAALNLVAAGRGLTVVPASMRVLHPTAIVYRPLRARSLPRLPLFLVHRLNLDVALVGNFVNIAKALAQPSSASISSSSAREDA